MPINSAQAPGAVSRSDVIAQAMKLVAPMRHEFGASVRIMNVLNDSDYARTVFDLASSSRNERLRQEAKYLERMIFGPREGPFGDAAHAPRTPARPPDAQAQAIQQELQQELEQRKADKYTRGLR